ncbi:MAG: hypothetical protein ABIF04_04770 [Chloroflexota bacterium]
MKPCIWAGITAITCLVLAFVTWNVSATEEQPPGPGRFDVITQDYISYEWWLSDWVDNKVACIINIDHDGLPTGDEVYVDCGKSLYDKWSVTKSCPQSEAEAGTCNGYYLHLEKSESAKRDISVQLSPPVVWVTLDGCVPYRSTFRCDALPTLVLTAEEPLDSERITSIAGRIDGKPFSCDPVCQVDLAPTEEAGLNLEFWAYSSYGDSSVLFQARVRVAHSEDASDHAWYADVLSSQWRGVPVAGCLQIWDVFPPVGGTPDWLSTPQRSEDLATSISYEYLAANLIEHGAVDASACTDGGLLEGGLASPCGLEVARPAVNEWQNRFDELIFAASQETGVSARLLKNIFSRESQFWPGRVSGHPEAGLGQMTEGGADAILMWNPSFYEQFCPLVLDQSICKTKIYPKPEDKWKRIGLDDTDRALLRSALVQSVDSVCPECPLGIDMQKADFSVGVFAQALLSNCEQAGMVIQINYSGGSVESATYEDLWRLTLVNYNAGPGCLGLAVDETSRMGEPLDWESVSSHLTIACQGALDYVFDISRSTQ